ncbi:GFA family protein [Algiphilus sp. W345]|uniref:GFA family protein n=1 Tax=Banduia mediterranea TaxID=3075609 RepID=A0ABU2WN75_9GAMM|nr:GFA family protein [Algiphilus sp. W345]MDT0498796.1 GFA family protein [Algiphilus sp. W345]
MPTETLAVHRGGCHCGAVRFEVTAPTKLTVQRCNCSICRMHDFLHLIVPHDRFSLLSGEDRLSRYTFNSGVAQHLFCSICGVKSFYVPRSNPDGYSVNLRCIDPSTLASVQIEDFDGQNWEANAQGLAALSNPHR